MATVRAFVNVSLDGVMQSPARPDEDTRGGFGHGGWGAPYAAMPEAGEAMANVGALLLGRRTYEEFRSVWPKRPESPFSAFMDNITKYVASSSLREPLPWKNSVLLGPHAETKLASLRTAPGKDIVIMGSGQLIHALAKARLIDEYVLLIHPVVLGEGRRLFSEGFPSTTFQLVASKTTSRGVLVGTFRPVRKDKD
jgi:dihydrofolate reductase